MATFYAARGRRRSEQEPASRRGRPGGYSAATVYRLVAEERLRHVRVLNAIRISVSELDALMGDREE